MILTKLRPTFNANFSTKKDEPPDLTFRHCRIEEREGEHVVRSFTGKVPRSQAARKQVKPDIALWCELHPKRLPKNGLCSTSTTYGNPCDVSFEEPVW